MTNTRRRMKTRQQAKKLSASQSAKPQSPESPERGPKKGSPKVSLRDSTNCQFETNKNLKQTSRGSLKAQDVPLEREVSKEVVTEPTANQTCDCKQAKRPKLGSDAISKPTSSKGGGLSANHDHKNSSKEKEFTKANRAELKRDPKESKTSETTKHEADKKKPESERSDAKVLAKERLSPKSLADTPPIPASAETPQNFRKDGSDITFQTAAASQQETDGNAASLQQSDGNVTSSSSSTSRRATRRHRVSFAYLKRTRGHRRAIAKARTERKQYMMEEAQERKRVRELEGLGEDQRKSMMRSIEDEKRKREAARRKQVKRVKNRESVEKSRVREVVLESEVWSEGDALRWENERMAAFLEDMKREKVLKEVKEEVAAFIKKRKRGKTSE